jgi:hypothetical protein
MWWVTAGAVVLLAIVMAIVRSRRGRNDLGRISESWIAQHRVSAHEDRNR